MMLCRVMSLVVLAVVGPATVSLATDFHVAADDGKPITIEMKPTHSRSPSVCQTTRCPLPSRCSARF